MATKKNIKPEKKRARKGQAPAITEVLDVYDVNDSFTSYASCELYKLLGYSEAECKKFTKLNHRGLFSPSDLPHLKRFLKHFSDCGDDEICEFEFRAKHRDKSWKWLRLRARVYERDKKKKALRYIAVTQDVTQMLANEQELNKRNQQLELFNEMFSRSEEISHTGTWIYDKESGKAFFTDNLFKLFGIEPGTVEQTFDNISNYILAEDRKRRLKERNNFIKYGKPYKSEYRITRTDGAIRYMLNVNSNYTDANGKQTLIGITQDITEQKLNLDKLQEQEQRYREAEKIGHMGSWERNLATGELIWSDELYRIYGLDPSTATVSTDFFISTIVHPEDRKKVRMHIAMIYNDHLEEAMEYRIVTSAGVKVIFSKPQITIKGNKVTAIRGIVQDITAQKEVEQEIDKLKQNQQKQILGAMLHAQEAERLRIGEALHNGVGQLLFGIKLKIDALPPPLPEHENQRKILNKIIEEAIAETKNISFDLVPTVLKDFGLETAIKDLISRSELGKIKLKFSYTGKERRCAQDAEVMIYRVVQEIINNLIRHSKASSASIIFKYKESGLMITYRDNGVGFNVNQIMQKGKGFGLRNIRSRIQLFDGELDIMSVKDKGTVMKIDMPCG
jgi:PAS domain S-box-containing protein